jgi:hypothetical protein
VKLYRCNNPYCKTTEFEAEQPVCPGCTTDARDPRFARFIAELATIHFDPPTHLPLVRQGHRACDKGPIPGFFVSSEPLAVTCKACKATDEFKKATKGTGKVAEQADFGVEPDGDTIKAVGSAAPTAPVAAKPCGGCK